jgi:hypothetical protein
VSLPVAPYGFEEDKLRFPPNSAEEIFGAHPDYADADDPTTPATYDSSDIIPDVGGIRSQGQTPSCVPWTFVEVISLAMVGQGLAPSLVLSPGLAYLLTMLETLREVGLPPPAPGAVMTMTGTQPSMCVAALARGGVGLESVRPFSEDPAVLLAAETIAEAADASSRIPITISAYALFSAAAGPGRILALRQGLSAFHGSALPCALSVDQAFNNCDGSGVLLAPDPATYSGGHMVSLCGYSTVVAVENNTAVLDYVSPASGKNVILQDPTGSLNVGDTCARVWNHWSTQWAGLSDLPGTAWAGPAFINALAWMYLVNAKLAAAVSGGARR